MPTLKMNVSPELMAVYDERKFPAVVTRFLQERQALYNAGARAGWLWPLQGGQEIQLDPDFDAKFSNEGSDGTKFETTPLEYGLDADDVKLLTNSCILDNALLSATKQPGATTNLADYFKKRVLIPAYQYVPEKKERPVTAR